MAVSRARTKGVPSLVKNSVPSSGSTTSAGLTSRRYFFSQATARSPTWTMRSFLPLPWRMSSVPRSASRSVRRSAANSKRRIPVE